MSEPLVVDARDSAVVGEHALVHRLAAALLLRAVGDWRRAIPRGTDPST